MSFEMIKLIARILIILLTFFQVSIIPVSANPIIFGQDHHSGISEVYTYDGIENSFWEKADLTDGLSQFLSAKVVRLDHEVFAGVVSVAAKGGQTIIGEGMKRVSMEAAKREGSVILNDMPKFTGTAYQVTSQMMTYNRQWILQQMRSGRPILDIGLDATRANPSIFYQMEQNMMRNYLKLHPNVFQVIKP
ncbi:hypothetical protein SAMN05444377_101244 [Flavobacterium fontis]|uniref:Uncharacterized protein n=1 Tax=Flavobacterium fontis TaxID=1124188 RepID=A0A1M4WC96_9FLAO|nr:hypothetical protein [Flavobacterium fontis]SHE78683.1 hypothetical protein SAMN05444377_101244 [Flavobacterium fontis]